MYRYIVAEDMAQVSKNRVRADVYSRMYEIFLDAIADVRSRRDVDAFVGDFLTPTERIMLPKRLAIAYLLMKGYEQRLISQYLKVSFTTITRVSNQLRVSGSGYRKVIAKIFADENLVEFLEKIDDEMVKLVGPAGPGSSNWSQWYKDRWRRKMTAKKPF